jgi:SSS family solute:Na+ symporter
MYAAVPALALNLGVAVMLTPLLRRLPVSGGSDETDTAAYVG